MWIIKASIAAASLAWLATAVVTARAQANIGECEKIQAADAYNQCLAKFGPESKVKSVEPGKPSDFKDSGEQAASSAGPAARPGKAARHAGHRRGGWVSRRSHGGGRKRMTIRVGKHRR